MTGELFPWALIACRDELEDVATSVFDLMGKTEATEGQIGKMVDQIFQVPSFSVCVCVKLCETLEKENPPLTANFQEMDGNGDGLVRGIIVIFLMLIITTTTTTV